MSQVIDADQHMSELPDMWREYADPGKRDLAVAIQKDDLGYWRLTIPALGKWLGPCKVTLPGQGWENSYGSQLKRFKQGLPATEDYLEILPEEHWKPSARVAWMDSMGIDKGLAFFQTSMAWPRHVPKDRLDIFQTNIEAWNRRCVDIYNESGGRLMPVGTASLRGGGDFAWLDEQLAFLGSNGIRAAQLTYGLIEGRRMSHPDHDRAWASFVEHGITPILHVQDSDEHASGLPEAWSEHDNPLFPLLDIVFFTVGIQISLTDLIFNGVFDRFPELTFCAVEALATWVPNLLGPTGMGFASAGEADVNQGTGAVGSMAAVEEMTSGSMINPNGTSLDVAYDIQKAAAGSPLCDLKMRPSDYLKRHVKATVSTNEPIRKYVEWGMEDMIMFASDFPHAEGLPRPVEDVKAAAAGLSAAQLDKLLGANAAAALHVS